MAKSNKVEMITPLGQLKWINLVKPDDHYDADNPKYQASLVLDVTEGRAFIQKIEGVFPQFKGKVPSKRDDQDNFIFKFTQKKFIRWKKDGEDKEFVFVPKLLLKTDDGQIEYEGSEPWSGSTGEVAIVLEETKGSRGTSLAMRLKGVRFHDVVIGTGDGAASSRDPLFGPSGSVSDTASGLDEDHPFGDDEAFN